MIPDSGSRSKVLQSPLQPTQNHSHNDAEISVTAFIKILIALLALTSVKKTAKQLEKVSKFFVEFRRHAPEMSPEAAVLRAFYVFIATVQMFQKDYKFRLFRAEDISHLLLVFVFLCLFAGMLLTHWASLLLKDQSWALLLTCLITVPATIVFNGLLAFATLHYDDEKINDPNWLYVRLSVAMSNLISVITLIVIHSEYQYSMPMSSHTIPSEGRYPADLVLCLLFLPVLEFVTFPSFAWWKLWSSYSIGVIVAVWSLIRIQATGMVSMVLLAICLSTICLLSLRHKALKSYAQYLHEEELQEEVLRTKAGAETQYAEMVRAMIAGVAHDLKTPLSTLTSCIDAFDQLTIKANINQALSIDVQEHQEDVKVKIEEFITDIRQVCDSVDLSRKYMQVMVNRYVDFAKVSNGLPLIPMLGNVAMKPLLDDIMHTADNFADCVVNWKVDPKTESLVMITDYLWFEESLICMLTNACKFSLPTEPIDIEVKAVSNGSDIHTHGKSIKGDGNWSLRVTVEDRGFGVALASRDSVFDYPLGQISANRGLPVQQQTGGAGLGLYTLAARVGALHGRHGYHPRLEMMPALEGEPPPKLQQRERGSVFFFQVPIVLALESPRLPPSLVGSFIRSPSMSRKSSKGGGATLGVPGEQPFVRAMKEPTRHLLSYCLTSSKRNVLSVNPGNNDEEVKSAGSSFRSSFAGHIDVQVLSPSGSSTPLPVKEGDNAGGEARNKLQLNSLQTIVVEEASMKKRECLRILVVDDSVSIRKMCGMVLSKQGHHVDPAVNGQDALDKLTATLHQQTLPQEGLPQGEEQTKKYDAVLMDIQMPGLDGIEATKLYRQREQEMEQDKGNAWSLLIIGMSACSDDMTAEQALECGMDFFLPKPFSINQFNDILAERYY